MELQLWASSCMIAFEDEDPVAVLIGCKRDHASWISRLAVKPEYQRKGHASHLLDSLVRKMAILGPPLVCLEIPQWAKEMNALAAGLGFSKNGCTWQDMDWKGQPVAARGASLIAQLEWLDVAQSHLVGGRGGQAWMHHVKTYEAIADDLTVWGVVADELLALAMFRDVDAVRELWLCDGVDSEAGRAASSLLLHDLCATSSGCVRAHRMNAEAPITALSQAVGFQPMRSYVGWEIMASSDR